MNITTIKKFIDKATIFLKSTEPTLVTRNGMIAGPYLPIEPDSFPFALRKELIDKLGESISRSLEDKGITEEKLIEEFEAFKKNRSRR